VIGISYDSDLLKTKVLLREILDNEKRVLKEPASLVEVKDLAASSVEFNVLPWVRTSDYADVRASLLETIKLRFDREKIVLPYPQMDLHVRHEPK
jgi:small conductance mechanosensitive channel